MSHAVLSTGGSVAGPSIHGSPAGMLLDKVLGMKCRRTNCWRMICPSSFALIWEDLNLIYKQVNFTPAWKYYYGNTFNQTLNVTVSLGVGKEIGLGSLVQWGTEEYDLLKEDEQVWCLILVLFSRLYEKQWPLVDISTFLILNFMTICIVSFLK